MIDGISKFRIRGPMELLIVVLTYIGYIFDYLSHTVSIICKRYGVSRKTYYKWNNRYKQKGIERLSDVSRRPHNIKYKKVTSEIRETILDLRLTKRFGCNRIKFRLKRIIGLSLSTRTIYKTLKRHGLNILKCKAKITYVRKYNI